MVFNGVGCIVYQGIRAIYALRYSLETYSLLELNMKIPKIVCLEYFEETMKHSNYCMKSLVKYVEKLLSWYIQICHNFIAKDFKLTVFSTTKKLMIHS